MIIADIERLCSNTLEYSAIPGEQVALYFLRRLDTRMFPKRHGWRVWGRKIEGNLFAGIAVEHPVALQF
jgi:hypothetical protein